jgi:hypothetical protein
MRLHRSIGSILLLTAALFASACGRSPQALILGKWEIEGMPTAFEFQKDNTALYSFTGITERGTYQLRGNDELELNFPSKRTKFRVAVTEQALEMTNQSHQTMVFKRVSDAASKSR